MDAEPQPHCGALAAAAAGSAGFAVETPYATAAAASDAPRIEIIGPAIEAETALPFSAPAKRPRRMGQCSEVADGGGNLEDRPRPRGADTFAARPRFSGQMARQFVSGALNLFLSVQTKPCLGHCTTRGLSLRRQATIFRLCGAAFFSGRMRAPSEIGMRLRGQDAYAPRLLPCRRPANVFCPLCGISIFLVPPSAVAEASGAASNQESIGELKRTERLPAS